MGKREDMERSLIGVKKNKQHAAGDRHPCAAARHCLSRRDAPVFKHALTARDPPNQVTYNCSDKEQDLGWG
eukprot:scaffold111233_cov37-Tisochrysis_lutea.AAC.2